MPYFLSVVVGMVVGAVFGALGAPPPAPDNVRGVLGIVGIFAGWMVAMWIRRRWS